MEKIERNKFSIGGQFWYEDRIFKDENSEIRANNIILDGASSSIRFIIECLKMEKNEYVLLPSYLCPTIIENFNKYEINIEFFNINRDLSIDLEGLKRKIQKINAKAVYIINYFGICYDKSTVDYFKKLKENGIIIIEDSVQALPLNWNETFIGDFVFNSLRKFAAADGSILIVNEKNNKSSHEFKVNYKYFDLIHKARREKTKFIEGTINNEEVFLELFNKAEMEYQKNNEISALTKEDRNKLLSINYEYIYNRRKENLIYLYDNFKNMSGINIITDIKVLDKFIPIGFVILIENRDGIRKELFNKRIFCPVLWDLSNEKYIEDFKESKYISEHILMIPIDQRYCAEDYMAVIEFFKSIQVKERY